MRKEVDKEGNICYYNDNNELHREGGPAVEYPSGYKAWYLNGKKHREGGPAIEWVDGNKWWYLNGVRHRVGGPAIEWSDGDKGWYLNGVEYNEEDYHKEVFLMKL